VPLFEPEVRNGPCRTICVNFGFGALAAKRSSDSYRYESGASAEMHPIDLTRWHFGRIAEIEPVLRQSIGQFHRAGPAFCQICRRVASDFGGHTDHG
jgi:hypothetical protein